MPSSLKPSNLTIILLITFAVTYSTLWSLHADTKDYVLGPHKLEWQQPSLISNRFPELISTNQWQFDYEAVEKLLLKIKKSKTGELILDPNMAKILEEAVSKLPLDMKKEALQRVEFLVTKSLAGTAGQKLATVLTHYYHYQQAENIANSPSKIDIKHDRHEKELNFQQTVLRQERYLGKAVTHHFFGRQNAITHYLYARLRINETTSLSTAQKQQQLNALQDRFKTNDE
jgi:hypothetical protein